VVTSDGLAGRSADTHYDGCYCRWPDRVRLERLRAAVPCTGQATWAICTSSTPRQNEHRVTFDQDPRLNPGRAPDGPFLYTRWNIPNAPTIHPPAVPHESDGTTEEYYGAVPTGPRHVLAASDSAHPTGRGGIVSGHHGVCVRASCCCWPCAGRTRADGVIQRIPGYHRGRA